MKIQVTLEFNSPEEAIVALGKYVKDAPAPVKSSSHEAPQAVQAPVAAGTPKRGRGRPPKNAKAEEPPKPTVVAAEARGAESPAPVADAGSSVAAPPEEKVSTQSAPPTEQDVIAALQACLNAVGMTKTRACFARFGVTRGSEVEPDQRAEFITYVGKVAKKEIDPEASA